MVKNPSPESRKVVVEVRSGNSVIASSSEKDKPPLEVKPNSTIVTSFRRSDGQAHRPAPEAPRNLSLRLRDAASGQEFVSRDLRPQIASPLEYIEIVKAQFVPPRPGEVNRARDFRSFSAPDGQSPMPDQASKSQTTRSSFPSSLNPLGQS